MVGLAPQLILDQVREQWRKMAERLDDFICSFDPPVPEGMDPLTVLLVGWIVFFCALALVLHFVKHTRTSEGGDIQAAVPQSVCGANNLAAVSSSASEKFNASKVSVPNNGNNSVLDTVDDSFISRVQSSAPFKDAVALQKSSPVRLARLPYVSGAPVANGADEDCVLWVNNVISWIYGRAEVRNNISQAWLSALNSHATKLSKEAGINLHFVDLRADSERADFSNVVVEAGPNDTVTVTADMVAQPHLTARLTYEQDGGTRSATYDTRVHVLRGRVTVATLSQHHAAVGRLDGWPEVQLELSLADGGGGGGGSPLEEQLRQESAREVVTSCLRGAVVDLNFSQEADFPPLVRRQPVEPVRSLSRAPSEGGGERITRRLLVKVVKAAGLGASKGCKEAYCVVEMDDPVQKFQTATCLDTDHPFWDESFVFDLSPNTSELLFEVFDKQQPRAADFLGLGIVGIEELLVSPSQRQIIPLLPRPYELQQPVSGSLTVEFLFVDETGTPVEEDFLPHRVTETSERRLTSGETLHTTRTTYTRPEDEYDGQFVPSMALKDMESKARPNAKKSTLIIHSSKKDDLDESFQSEGSSDVQEFIRSATLPVPGRIGDETERGRKRSKRRSFFGSLRKRLGGSKSRSKSTDPAAGEAVGAARSASLDRPSQYLTVPCTAGVGGGGSGGADDSSLSDLSGISNASNRTYVNDDSTLVLETTENGVVKRYVVPNSMARRPGRWRKKNGTKLHVFNEHVFVAKHLPSALCSVCEKSLPRWLGKQAYECRGCRVKVHKQCHVRVETVCAETSVHTMELEYLQPLDEKRQRNMTR